MIRFSHSSHWSSSSRWSASSTATSTSGWSPSPSTSWASSSWVLCSTSATQWRLKVLKEEKLDRSKNSTLKPLPGDKTQLNRWSDILLLIKGGEAFVARPVRTESLEGEFQNEQSGSHLKLAGILNINLASSLLRKHVFNFIIVFNLGFSGEVQ